MSNLTWESEQSDEKMMKTVKRAGDHLNQLLHISEVLSNFDYQSVSNI